MGTHSNIIFHVVFSTKGRLALITESIKNELYRYIAGLIKEENVQLFKIGGIDNHVHIAIKLKPRHHVPDLMKLIKAKSSKWINEHGKIEGRFSWQVGYGIFSVSESQLAHVVSYIENQVSHHKTQTFEDEFVQLLKKHAVDFNSKYLWT